jgi:hypothetical protein
MNEVALDVEKEIFYTTDYFTWVDKILQRDKDLPFDRNNITCLKEIVEKRSYMYSPIGVYNGKSIAAVSRKGDSLADIRDEIKKENFILYQLLMLDNGYILRGAYV